ncbi:molecular chaperone DnaK [Variovorax sp. WS11]|uniref:TraR/DksA family transcriptional regulator n=1 Tax=Variovorax sp. WS11 TaxID=1105204 RepID=UPI000D0D8E14|nr:TraR/DksA family transcriptional regulator [Variovorax sp. WS11]NDZ18399.1 TraR/DksA family transcriptional regulator [Variovorax sp. WS11]PSL81694.1 molecular chaperone DnaK [Variovorax sp. WS11]
MKHLTAADREALTDRLRVIKRSVLEELRRTAGVDETSRDPQDHEVRSHADEAEAFRFAGLHCAEIEIDRARLKDVEEAQQRMAEGRYGICVDCGEDIPRERLVAQPIAVRCAACQAAFEAGHRR